MLDDLVAARMQMVLSPGRHIVVACRRVASPLLVRLTEWRRIRPGGDAGPVSARRWAEGLAVGFAVGADERAHTAAPTAGRSAG